MDDNILDDSQQSTSTTSSSTPLNQNNNRSSDDVTRNAISQDESRRNSLTLDDMSKFDQLTLSAAEALKSKLTDMDDFTFKRKNPIRSTGNRLFPRSDTSKKRESGYVSTSLRKHNDEEFDGDVTEWTMEGTGRRVAYDDFTTIDWIHDFAKERARQKRLHQQRGIRGKLNIMFDAMEGWIVVLAVGVASGILAAIIDITSDWLSDLKEGYCKTAFYLNRRFCCLGYEDEQYECNEWITWNSALQARSAAAEFWTNYFFYIIFSTLFATTAAYLVKTYSPYSAGSGIPEVKTILGGFVIRKFLGWWTLIIKSIGVVNI